MNYRIVRKFANSRVVRKLAPNGVSRSPMMDKGEPRRNKKTHFDMIALLENVCPYPFQVGEDLIQKT